MVWRRYAAGAILLCIVSCMKDFYSKKQIDREKLEQHPTYTVYTVITLDGEVFEFEPSASLHDSMIVGMLKDSSSVEIPLSRVHSLDVRKLDEMKVLVGCAAASLGAAIGTVLGIYLVIWLESKN